MAYMAFSRLFNGRWNRSGVRVGLPHHG